MRRSRLNGRLRHRVATAVIPLVVGLAVGSCGGPGASGGQPDPALSAHLPDGYALQLDRRNRAPENFVATVNDGELVVRTGPAGILYRPDQMIDAPSYTVRARFSEIDALVGHREGFGLFVGGQDLEGSEARYVYFLVRGDGRYLIKRRAGDSTLEISDGWQPSAAVRAVTVGGAHVTNELAIVADGGRLRFVCNGEPVGDLPIGDLSPQGVVGVRVNHNLQVRIEEFRVEP